ncbi:MAG TPA: hypothetical protein IGS53_04110 [Leptolyngbyaceae cyanobacterium M33_DOE_097]|uniref:Uncharacterized protein n=1 Tax=Oscillatoriales cyanobacterium SpSt-418 TaxID=2282169 RepID=A0A7C3PGK1_9CYAN|nr:hypothetical protein [Leptolyngbyaceae cyanobacterium M33_DOE_097]
MPRYNPYTLQMQITRMFEQGQSFFAMTKVQDWLRERNEDPANYDIAFHQRPAPPGSQSVIAIEIELRRKDGQPIDDWILKELNRHA